MAEHAEADGEDGLEVVVLDGATDTPLPLGSNYQVRLDSCPRAELALRVHILQMQVDVLERGLEQLGEPTRGCREKGPSAFGCTSPTLGEPAFTKAVDQAVQDALAAGKIKSLSAGKMDMGTRELGDLIMKLVS